MKFNVGESVIIIRGDRVGMTGIIHEHKCVCNVLDLYSVEIRSSDDDKIVINDIPEEDLKSIERDIVTTTTPIEGNLFHFYFNVNDYLTETERKTIAKDIFKERVTNRIDEIIKARSVGSDVDTIFNKLCEKYVDKLGSEIEDDILRKIKEAINIDDESKIEDYDDTFIGSIKYKLRSVTDNWIDDHKDEVIEWIKPHLKIFVERMSDEGTSRGISDRLSKIMSETLCQVIHEIYEKGI